MKMSNSKAHIGNEMLLIHNEVFMCQEEFSAILTFLGQLY